MSQSYSVIEIHTHESVRYDGKPVSEALISYVRKLKNSARCSVFRGIEGCCENGEVSTEKIVDLSINQPLKIEIVLPAAELDSVIDDVLKMVQDGIVGTRELTVLSHRTKKRLFPPQTRVRDVMTQNPVSVEANETAAHAMKILLSANFTGLPVVDPENRPIGVISQTDLIYRAGMPFRIALMAQSHPEKLEAAMRDLSAKPARSIMTKPPILVCETDLLTHAVHIMLKNDVKRLPVVDKSGFLTGMVSRLDVFETITREAPDWQKLQERRVHVGNIRFVSEIMQRETRTVTPETPVEEVMRVIDRDDIKRVAVVNSEGRLMGLISDRSLLSAFSGETPGVWEMMSRLVPFSAKAKHAAKIGEKLSGQSAGAVMKPDPITIRENEPIDGAISLMTRHKIKRLPVVDEKGIFKGMISREALLKEGFSAMKDYIPSS